MSEEHKLMRVAIGEIKQESNSFSPLPTTLDSFADGYLLYGEEIGTRLRNTNSEVGGFLSLDGAETIPTVAAWSLSGGPLGRDTFAFLTEALLRRVQQAGRLDGILLALHGAMLVEGIDDADGAILAALRAQVGPDLPLVVTLDLHANLTQLMVDACNLLVPYRTYPHVDQFDTGARAARLLQKIVHDGLRPVTALEKVPMLVYSENQQTTHGPMAHLMGQADALATRAGMVAVSILPVQPWLDVPDLGLSVLATADDDEALARHAARTLAVEAWRLRQAFDIDLVPVDEAIRLAVESPAGPVVLADSADSTGSGSPGDSTAILAALLRAPLSKTALLTMVDPETVATAQAAGLAAQITVPIGGKIDHIFNRPVEVTATVRRLLTDGKFRMSGPAFTGLEINMGGAAVLEAGQVRILVTERRVWTNDPALYRAAGLEPEEAQIVVVKSPNLFRASYEAMASRIILVDGPGTSTSNYRRLPFSRIPRPMFPLDAMADDDYPPRAR
jgi:microcystin degradation protein MlrC